MGVTITPVTTCAERRAFLNLPRHIYAGIPQWIEPLRLELRQRLNPKRNSFFRRAEIALFLARIGRDVVGRISAQIDRAAHPQDPPAEGNFGFYEAINDPAVGAALFAAAREWLQVRRCRKMVGPYHFRLEDPGPGFLLKGHELRPTFMMPYTPPYYVTHAERAGLTSIMQLNSYAVTKERPLPAEFLARADEARQIPGIAVRPFDMRHKFDEAEILRQIFNEALQHNWGYVPMSSGQVRGMVKALQSFADPRIILFAEVDGRPVGAVINLPNLNDILYDCHGRLFPKGLYRLLLRKSRIKGLRGYAFAILPEYQRRGVGCLLVAESFARAIPAGYTYGEVTWILGSNLGMNELTKGFGGVVEKQYGLMGCELTAA